MWVGRDEADCNSTCICNCHTCISANWRGKKKEKKEVKIPNVFLDKDMPQKGRL